QPTNRDRLAILTQGECDEIRAKHLKCASLDVAQADDDEPVLGRDGQVGTEPFLHPGLLDQRMAEVTPLAPAEGIRECLPPKQTLLWDGLRPTVEVLRGGEQRAAPDRARQVDPISVL